MGEALITRKGISEPIKEYGVRWFKTAASPILTRLKDSIGYEFSASVGTVAGASSFDDKPIYKDIRLCNYNNGTVTYNDISRKPASGDVVVEIPKFYYKIDYSNSSYTDFYISNYKLYGYETSPAHMDRGDGKGERDYIYIGAYISNSSYKSISGSAVAYSITRASGRTKTKNRGSGYYQWDFAAWWTVNLLYLVETANWNSQNAIGPGFTGGSTREYTGGTDSVAGHSGRAALNTTASINQIKYRHMEDLWGNMLQWLDGINTSLKKVYICLNPNNFADDTSTNYELLSFDCTGSGFISALGYDSKYNWAMLPTAGAGSATTYLCDNYCGGNGAGPNGFNCPCVGGSWSFGTQAGLFSFNGHYESGQNFVNNSTRLMILP